MSRSHTLRPPDTGILWSGVPTSPALATTFFLPRTNTSVTGFQPALVRTMSPTAMSRILTYVILPFVNLVNIRVLPSKQ